MPHHSIKHREQIQVDQANLDKFTLYIVLIVLDSDFPKSFHVSSATTKRPELTILSSGRPHQYWPKLHRGWQLWRSRTPDLAAIMDRL
ncbi:MAG TPA: hypothetical protein VFO40_10375 [Chthoniobacterales bacterium]|nr:hypothetical protein [Chthoniobacterales bacterium]